MNFLQRNVYFILLILLTFGGCAKSEIGTENLVQTPSDETNFVGARRAAVDSANPLIKARLTKIREILGGDNSVLTLENLDENQKTAQDLAINDPRFRATLRQPNAASAELNEIFGVYPLRESDFNGAAAMCRNLKCYRVEKYNFARNSMVNAVVEVSNKTVLSVAELPQMQPDIPPHLTEIAVSIAANSTEVAAQLGIQPTTESVLMPNTKTALNKSRCERSKHLCVAPTFTRDAKAIWAIVDLTDLTLVGVRATKVGATGKAVTEKNLQNDFLIKEFCERAKNLNQNGWKFDYILTSSDGLRVSDLSFNGKPVARDIKLVDWHVSYSGTEGFGYSDAVGCPVFSQAAVIAVEPPKIENLIKDEKEIGFALTQDFWSEGYPTPCNYYYSQRYEFYNDGRFRPAVASFGRGCGDNGIYRPVTRIAFAGDNLNFAAWRGADWENWRAEQWENNAAKTAANDKGFQYRVADAENKGFHIEPARGQFGDGGRGDNAFVYVTRRKPDADEGDSDLTTIGPCCNTDYRQGPEKFIEPAPDSIENAPLNFWYVAQLQNDDDKGREYCWSESVLENGVYRPKQYPCWSGPMIHPF